MVLLNLTKMKWNVIILSYAPLDEKARTTVFSFVAEHCDYYSVSRFETLISRIERASKNLRANFSHSSFGWKKIERKLLSEMYRRISKYSKKNKSQQGLQAVVTGRRADMCVIVENLVNDWAFKLMIFMITLDLYRSLQKKNRNKFWFLFTVKRLS